MKVERWQLEQKQSMPLDIKILMSEWKIRQWYKHWKGKVYVSFSGGKDSTVLLHLVRGLYPEMKAVFIDTGLEFPEIRCFVRKTDNVVWIRPKRTFKEVIDMYGFPVVSKKVSMGLDRYRNTKSIVQKQLRLWGGTNPTSGKRQAATIPQKWHFLANSSYRFSDRCCDILKKNPANSFSKKYGMYPYLGVMASDSSLRREVYLREGCNGFTQKKPKSMPLSFWLEQDIWDFIERYALEYSDIYRMGYKRTGCAFCMFGVHMEEEPNRFQMMSFTHPKLHDYCINKLGCGEILDYMKVPYEL